MMDDTTEPRDHAWNMPEGQRSMPAPRNSLDNRTRFRDELIRLEDQVMGGLDLIVSQLDRAVEAINYQDIELAAMVAADDRRIDGRYIEVHQGVLSLLGRQALFADDLRLAAALLHTIRCIERMGDQCANMAKLVPLSGYEAPKDPTILELIEKMGISVRAQILQTRDAFRTRHVSLARDLVRQDVEVNRLNRDIFQRAVDAGDDAEVREWAMFMILVARCLERIGDNTVDIAEQTVFVVTGLYREFAESQETHS
jgi:phosphate transport system protein